MVTHFLLESRNPSPIISSTQNNDSWIEIAAVIAVLISKYVTTLEIKSLIETDDESSWLGI